MRNHGSTTSAPPFVDSINPISAARAGEIGLYNHVVPDAELADVAMRMATELAAGPTMGLAMTKRMLNAEASMTLGESMAAEGWIQAECMTHPDYAEAHRAFVEKRAPRFGGGGS